jgi:iron complex outermembrane recepter protein
MSKINQLSNAIKFALIVGASASMATASVFAQEEAKDEIKEIERVEVTGTRIRQVDKETSQPVLVISRADIEKQGFQSVSDILQNVTATGTPPLSRASPLSAGEAAGGTFISLRNLGAARTLVLLNGRRLGITTSGLSDISTIPAIAIERIEVLKDGASSIYGSDAVAGVINIITRSNFEGAKASAYYGQYSEGDGAITRGDFIIGFAGDKGSLTAAAEWTNEDKVAASDRPYSAFPRSNLHPTDGWTTVGQFGGFVTTATTAVPGLPAGTRVILRPGGDPRVLADYIRQDTNTGTCAGATAAGCTPGSTLGKSNTNEQTDLRTPLESRSLSVDGTYNITDRVTFRTNLLFNNRTSERQVAGFPMQAASFATPMAATSYFNPTGVAITNWWRRTWEVPRVSDSDLTTYRFTGALEGSFDFADRVFDWDVSYLKNTNKLNQSNYGNLNVSRTLAAVGPSFLNAQGQVQCGTAAAPIAFSSCVPFNPFLPFGTVGQGGLTNNQQLQDFLFQEEHSTGETSTTVIAANIAGSLFALPAGDLSFALGIENRKEEGSFVPDALAVTGNSTNLAAGPTRGSYSVDEIYAELQVPLLKDMAFAEDLSLSLASRYSDYDTFGNTRNDKAGFKWKPHKSVLVRGTWAEGFRAPTIADLFGGGSQTFSFFTDPCDTLFGSSATNATTRANCVAAFGPLANTYRQLGQGFVPVGTTNSQTPVAFSTVSTPTLQPETSVSKNFGVVWSPDFIEGLNLSLDWWNIRIENTIVADAPNTILNDCFIQGIASRCSPQLFTRDPTLGFINFLSFGSINAGYREIEGFDFDVSYRFATDSWGTFTAASNTTYTDKDVLITTNDPRFPINTVGFVNGPTIAFRVRSNMNIGWQKGDFSANWMMRYYSSQKEACTYAIPAAAPGGLEPNLECNVIDPAFPTGALNPDGTPVRSLSRFNRVGSVTFNDVQVRWQAPWNATISVGANNVFDKVGPVKYSQPSSNVSYYGGFDIGRFWYMKYTQTF